MLICEFPVNCIFVTFHLTLTVQNLWLPDVEILDLKAFETHSVLSKLEGCKDFLKTQNWTKNENAACAQICCADEDSLDMSKLCKSYFQQKSVAISFFAGIWIDSNLEVMYALATR